MLEVGYLYVTVAVILFSLFPLPTKTSECADGVFFQFLMCCGIWIVGASLYYYQCLTTSECPQYVPLASAGGAIWALSNLFLIPIVQTVGVGVCMTAWGTTEMLTGWATAKFGLFGISAQPVTSIPLNYGGVAMALCSLLTLALAQSLGGSDDGAVRLIEDDGSSSSISREEDAYGPLLAEGINDEELSGAGAQISPPFPFPPNRYAFWDRFSPLWKRVFGFGCAILAGMMSGSMFTPVQYIVDHQTQFPGTPPRDLLGNLNAHFSGILLTSLASLIMYCVATGGRPWVSSELVLPALASGVCWGVACIFWFLANQTLSIVIAFPLVTVSPGLLSMMIGGAFFKEVKGWRMVGLLGVASALFVGAAVCIALSGATG